MLPERSFFQNIGEATLIGFRDNLEFTIRLVDVKESQHLNNLYRNSNHPTNVLSFPSSGIEEFVPGYLGDLVICPGIVEDEANRQKKHMESHWAHIVVHGILHLMGLDHKTDKDALIMEEKERRVLSGMKIADPYLSDR